MDVREREREYLNIVEGFIGASVHLLQWLMSIGTFWDYVDAPDRSHGRYSTIWSRNNSFNLTYDHHQLSKVRSSETPKSLSKFQTRNITVEASENVSWPLQARERSVETPFEVSTWEIRTSKEADRAKQKRIATNEPLWEKFHDSADTNLCVPPMPGVPITLTPGTTIPPRVVFLGSLFN